MKCYTDCEFIVVLLLTAVVRSCIESYVNMNKGLDFLEKWVVCLTTLFDWSTSIVINHDFNGSKNYSF